MWKNMSVWEVSYYCIFVLFFFDAFLYMHLSHFFVVACAVEILLICTWPSAGPYGDSNLYHKWYSFISWEPWWICGNKLCPSIGSLGIALPCQNRAAFIFRGRSAAYSWIFVPQSTLWCRHKCMQSRIMLCTFS